MCFQKAFSLREKISKIAISDTLGVDNAMVRAQTKDVGEEKGSTSHPRGKQWLTVYRAHQVACRDGACLLISKSNMTRKAFLA